MKLELKNVKHAEFASQETHCFEAKLYVDGVFSPQISNEGRGGSNYVWWEKGVPISEKQIEEYLTTNVDTLDPTHNKEWSDLRYDLEIWVGNELNRILTSRKLKRDLKKKIIFVKDNELWEAKFKTTITPMQIEGWKRKNPKVTKILNTMAFDKALELYQ